MTEFTGKRHGFTRDDFAPYFKGNATLPNFKELELPVGLGMIAAGGGLRVRQEIDNIKLPGSTRKWGGWARYFLGTGQGGSLDGTGLVIWYDKGVGRIGRFALCNHVKHTHSDANPTRGWHPGHCVKCGLDLTVDSSG